MKLNNFGYRGIFGNNGIIDRGYHTYSPATIADLLKLQDYTLGVFNQLVDEYNDNVDNINSDIGDLQGLIDAGYSLQNEFKDVIKKINDSYATPKEIIEACNQAVANSKIALERTKEVEDLSNTTKATLADYQKTVDEQQKVIAQVEADYKNVNSNINQFNSEYPDKKKAIDEAVATSQSLLTAITQQNNEAQTKLDTINKQIETNKEIQTKIENIQTDIATKQSQINEAIKGFDDSYSLALKDLDERIQTIQDKLPSKEEIDDLINKINKAESDLNQLDIDLTKIKQDIANCQAQLKAIQDALDKLHAQGVPESIDKMTTDLINIQKEIDKFNNETLPDWTKQATDILNQIKQYISDAQKYNDTLQDFLKNYEVYKTQLTKAINDSANALTQSTTALNQSNTAIDTSNKANGTSAEAKQTAITSSNKVDTFDDRITENTNNIKRQGYKFLRDNIYKHSGIIDPDLNIDVNYDPTGRNGNNLSIRYYIGDGGKDTGLAYSLLLTSITDNKIVTNTYDYSIANNSTTISLDKSGHYKFEFFIKGEKRTTDCILFDVFVAKRNPSTDVSVGTDTINTIYSYPYLSYKIFKRDDKY